jgi:hypothetical protein
VFLLFVIQDKKRPNQVSAKLLFFSYSPHASNPFCLLTFLGYLFFDSTTLERLHSDQVRKQRLAFAFELHTRPGFAQQVRKADLAVTKCFLFVVSFRLFNRKNAGPEGRQSPPGPRVFVWKCYGFQQNPFIL